MVTRLKASEAAALTATRVKEREERVKLLERERKLKSAQSKKFARLWENQASLLIESAINRRWFLEIKSELIGPRLLMERGFRIAFVDIESIKTAAAILTDRSRSRLAELNSIVTSEIAGFIRLVGDNDRYKGMTVTKENVIRKLLSKIKDYQEEMMVSKPVSNELFYRLFDGDLFLLKPIDSLKPKVQALQNAINNVKHSASSTSGGDLEYTDDAILKVTRYLVPSECEETMVVPYDEDYYRIEWGGKYASPACNFSEFISAPAMSWLAGDYGQRVLELTEGKIRDAINSAKSSVKIRAKLSDEFWSCEIGGVSSTLVPSPDQFSQILRVMGYSVNTIFHNGDAVSIEISWGKV